MVNRTYSGIIFHPLSLNFTKRENVYIERSEMRAEIRKQWQKRFLEMFFIQKFESAKETKDESKEKKFAIFCSIICCLGSGS